MNRVETFHPKDRAEWLALRVHDVTSSEVAALFGLSPYITPFELFHRKRDAVVVDDSADLPEFVRWGSRLESAIALGVAEDNGWTVRPMKEYMRRKDIRLGSSFDYSIETPDLGLLECKNVLYMKFRDEWAKNEDGTIEAPPHIELQIQNELALSGRKVGYIAGLVGGNQISLIRRDRDEAVIKAIEGAVTKFWDMIKKDTPPPPDFTRDPEFIAHLYRAATKGKTFDARGELNLLESAIEYQEASKAEKAAKERKDAAKARILMGIGDAEKVFGDNWSLSAGTVAGGPVSYIREPYRGFRLTWRSK